jgi:opacity protein-like surface antigen
MKRTLAAAMGAIVVLAWAPAAQASYTYRLVGGLTNAADYHGETRAAFGEIVLADSYVLGTRFENDYGQSDGQVLSFTFNDGWMPETWQPGQYSGSLIGMISDTAANFRFNCARLNACGVEFFGNYPGEWVHFDQPDPVRTGTYLAWQRVPEPGALVLVFTALLGAGLAQRTRPGRATRPTAT